MRDQAADQKCTRNGTRVEDFDVNTQERIAWRARCEQLAADYLAVVDVRDVIEVDALEVDALELDESIVEERAGDPAAA
jgi:hypothetical protein